MIKKIVITLVYLLIASPVFATTYWISPTGAAANLAACSGETPLEGTAACSYDKANGSGVAAGDTVYYRAGSYTGITGVAINPANSGTAYNNRITFSGYESETVTFVGGGTYAQGVLLKSKEWIYITKLNFTYMYRHLQVGDRENDADGLPYYPSHHNEISYCTFKYEYNTTGGDWGGSRIWRGSTYNHIHHNTFSDFGHFEPNDNNMVFGVGVEESNIDLTHYNLIEDNHFYHGGHHVVDINGYQNVWRNNYIRNDAWSAYNGTNYGNRVTANAGTWPYVGRTLFEGNRVAYGGECADAEWGGSSGYWISSYNIMRGNVFFQNLLNGLYLRNGGSGLPTQYNKIYNNTFWYNGYSPHTGDLKVPSNWEDRLTHGIWIDEGASVNNNTIKNNIFYNNENAISETRDIVNSSGAVPTLQSISYNFHGDPTFTSITGTPDPALIDSQFDFTLQSASGALDAGTYLTQVNDADGCVKESDTCTALVVDDASYFFDGWTMAANIPSATISADYICVGTVSNCAQISSINYDTNTITLATELSWSNDDPVWLQKNSSGTQVLYGNAPDAGAHEYVSSDTPPSQTVTVSTVGTGCSATHNGDYIVYAGDTLNVSYTITSNYNTPAWSGTCPSTGTTTRVCTPTGTQTIILTCGDKTSADSKVGTGSAAKIGTGATHRSY